MSFATTMVCPSLNHVTLTLIQAARGHWISQFVSDGKEALD
jgi:hypothetical protein